MEMVDARRLRIGKAAGRTVTAIAMIAVTSGFGAWAAGAVLLGRSSIADDDKAAASTSLVDPGALVTARQQALAFFSLDYRNAEQDVADVLALATGEFKEQYAAKQGELIAQVKKEKVVTTAVIPEAGVAVEFASGNEARVLVAVDVTQASGATVFQPRNRARIIVQLVDGRWLVSGVNQVG